MGCCASGGDTPRREIHCKPEKADKKEGSRREIHCQPKQRATYTNENYVDHYYGQGGENCGVDSGG